jgi:Mg-chelatase subunit ChlD
MGRQGLEEATGYLGAARVPFDLVAFGARPRLLGEGVLEARLEGDPRDRTDLAEALRFAAGRASGEDPLRVVLLSDGRPTEPGAEEAALHLRRERVEVWAAGFPSTVAPAPPDVRAGEIELPPPRARREPFTLRAAVTADEPTSVRATLFLDGVARASRQVELAAGEGEVAFANLSLPPGHYFAQVLLEGDETPADNMAATRLDVPGTPRVLLLGAAKRKALLAEALSVQGIEPEVAAAANVTEGLDEYDAAVILPDAPAADLDRGAAALADFVGRKGRGLVAVGGLEGPGLARLHGTPTAQLLPVEVPPRPEPRPPPPRPEPGRKPRVEIIEEKTQAYPISLCLVVDHSGSMHGRKMEQAKAAAAAAAQALTDADRISVVAFSDTAALIVRPMRAGNPQAVLRELAGLQAHGRTAMYQALSMGYRVLLTEPSPIRHMVLISDGIPTDDGPWRTLILTQTREKITLSTVGIGFEIDSHLLGRFATWGRGRYWMANRPHRVPQVVTQDTRRIVEARDRRGRDAERAPPEEEPSPEVEEPEPPPEEEKPAPPPSVPLVADPSAPREMLKGLPDDELPEVAGYEEGQARFASWTAVRAGEGGPPLLVYGRIGLGTVAALLVDPESEGGRGLREHDQFPRLVAQLLRSVLPDVSQEPLYLRHETLRREGAETLAIRVLAEDGLPRTDLDLEADLDGKPLEIVRRGGRFEAALPRREEPGRVVLRVSGRKTPLLERALAVPRSANPERDARGADRTTLLRLAGSEQRLDAPPERALAAPERTVAHSVSLTLPFLLLAAILLPLDAWARRRARLASR